ncbi:prefoldin subunit 6 [Rhodofomes roseus]|uniref:Prefoldin subunit 6 n=1 Tax=Rhodofomes roseus TaxID=34475 RepID=A0ABQ8K1H3_9APHY|nr:prefoldin subunit 6 [Rhodofomes roseus]KAH9830516.1 prefoldin subunit 6 [Rhodofomes roseus]
MSTSLAALQDRLQSASADFQKIQNDMATAVDARQRLEAQQSENELVKKACPPCTIRTTRPLTALSVQEFATLTDRNTVYKLVGPVLVQQDQAEAKANVDKRLEFIQSEIKRIEGQIKDYEEKADKKKLELVEIQGALQQQLKTQAPPTAVAA